MMYLSDAINLYTLDRAARGIKPNTVRREKYELSLLLQDVGNIQVHQLKPQHMDLYWSRRTTWGPSTCNLARATISNFMKWCTSRGHIKADRAPLDVGRARKEVPRKRIIIPQHQFSTFLDGIEDPRGRAICAIGLYLFTRISETQGLRWQDINMEDGTVEVFREKTSTLDTLPLCEELHHELKRWQLTYAAAIGRPLLPRDLVIPGLKMAKYTGIKGKKGKWVVTKSAEYLPNEKAFLTYSIKQALKKAGYYQSYEGGHTLRRSGAIALYNELSRMGHDRAMRVCQAMLGHAHIQTTEVYLRLDLDRKVRNDLLAGKRMFSEEEGAEVRSLVPESHSEAI